MHQPALFITAILCIVFSLLIFGVCSFKSVHSGIRSLQCILLKICLLLGVQIYTNVEFVDVLEPEKGIGWRASVKPESHQVSKCEFDFIVGKLFGYQNYYT